MIVRRASAADADAVRAVHAAAFVPAEPGAPGVPAEVRLVDGLAADGDLIEACCFVAELDGQVVGHVALSRGTVDGREGPAGLGPIGVRPPWQRRGVGSALMHAAVAAADALDLPGVVLLGDPAFYARFGFVRADARGLLPPEAEWDEYFQLRVLTTSAPPRGTYRYAPAFDRL